MNASRGVTLHHAPVIVAHGVTNAVGPVSLSAELEAGVAAVVLTTAHSRSVGSPGAGPGGWS